MNTVSTTLPLTSSNVQRVRNMNSAKGTSLMTTWPGEIRNDIVAKSGLARVLPWHTLAAATILILAAWLRLAELDVASLTHDEAVRANIAYGLDSICTQRRLPLLQLVMSSCLQHGLGRTELVVRLPYALAGVGCVVLVYLFVRRHFGRNAALLTAATTAFHPALVALSRKAKVFSLESLVAAALLWTGYEAYRRPSRRTLLSFVVVGVVAVGLTFTGALVVAAWLPLLAVAVWRRSRDDRRVLPTFVFVTVVLAAAFGGAYAWLAGTAYGRTLVQYQQQVFHSWPESYAAGPLAVWLASRSYGTLSYLTGMSEVWPPLKWFVGTAGMLAAAAALGVWWRQHRALCVYSGVLAAEVIVAAAVRLWPMGDNQTVMFLIPLFAVAVGCGLGEFMRRVGRSPATVLMLACCIFLPAARATKAALAPPPLEQHLRPVFAYTAAHLRAGDALFTHYETRDAYGFYWQPTGHPVFVQPFGSRDNVTTFAAQFDPWIAEHPRVWFVFMLRRPNEVGPWLDYLRGRYQVREAYRYNDAAVYLVER
jgi:hypothetical protein